MKDLIHVLNSIVADDNLKLDTNSVMTISKFFNDYLKNEKENEELKKEVGEEKYQIFCDKVKKLNADYYAFKWFNNTEKISDKYIFLEKIFENYVLWNNEDVINKLKKQFSKEEVKHLEIILSTLKNLSFFCCANNLRGNKYSEILNSFYFVNKEIADRIGNIFTENITDLKLDFIISNINEKAK